jgi:hypothetical protein
MDDFTYDIVQKKRIARGARHKKNGSKSKWCHLPSDNLTAKQLKERNGPIMNYALNVPMDWEAFKSMPRDLQQQYLDNLHARFNVGVTTISRELFGMSDATLNVYAKRVGLKTRTASRLNASERELWENWINGVYPEPAKEPEETVEEPEEEIVEEDVEPETVEEPTVASEEPKPVPTFSPGALSGHDLFNYIRDYGRRTPDPEPAKPLGLNHLSATFTGEFDAEKFLNWITKLPMPEGDVRISVEVSSR